MYYYWERNNLLNSKNLLNNQNYVINKKLKFYIIFDYLTLGNFIFSLLKKFIYKLYYWNRFNWNRIFSFFVIHIYILIFCLVFLFLYFFFNSFLFLVLYIISYFYLSIKLFDLYRDVFLTDVKVLWFRKFQEYDYFDRSYKNTILSQKLLRPEVIDNNFLNILLSIFYSVMVNLSVYYIYLLFVK